MKIQCPKCQEEIEGCLTAMIPEEQMIFMKLTTTSNMLAAKTLGHTIVNMEKLLISVAKDVGGSVSVFVRSIQMEPHATTIEFCIINNRTQPAPPKPARARRSEKKGK